MTDAHFAWVLRNDQLSPRFRHLQHRQGDRHTALFVLFFVDSFGRNPSLFISGLGMGIYFFIIGTIVKTHPLVAPAAGQTAPAPPPLSKAMAAMALYIYVCFYSMGWGPLPWVYVSDIFPTRHYGLAVASGSQWLWSTYHPGVVVHA